MSAITNLKQHIPTPRVSKLEAVKHLVVRVDWSEGIRSGRTDVVDLSPMVNSLKLYRPLRDNDRLFRTVHLIENGRVLAWGDDGQIDMAADSVEALAEETMTGADLREFLSAFRLTHNEAAVQLGRSRRQIENYLSDSEPIPRVVVLACFGLVARMTHRGPITSAIRVKSIDQDVIESDLMSAIGGLNNKSVSAPDLALGRGEPIRTLSIRKHYDYSDQLGVG